MKKSRIKHKPKFNFVKFTPPFLLLIVLLFTIAYSAASDNLSIGNVTAAIRLSDDTRITAFSVLSTANGGSSSYDYFSKRNVSSRISLPNSNSSVTYTIDITNLGSDEVGLMAITGLSSALEYTLSGYTLEATLCDSNNNSICTLNAVTTMQLTITYAENAYDGIDTDFDVYLNFDIQEMQYAARIGGTYYATLSEAIEAVPTTGVETTVVLLKNIYDRITLSDNRNVVLDFPNLVLHSELGNDSTPVVEIMSGSTLKMSNGTIVSASGQSAVNVELGGTFIMTGGYIEATGGRQAVWVNNGGTATISGNSHLVAAAVVETSATGKKRGTVETINGGTLTILGGTFEAVGTNGIAVSCAGTITIGSKDGNVSTTIPEMDGVNYGVYIAATGNVRYYDGIAKGKVAAINDESAVSDRETGYGFMHSSEVISGATYQTVYLSLGQDVVVTFDPNGGSVSEQTRRVIVGTQVGGLPIPTWSGHTFLGWLDSNNREIYASEIITQATTFTASWETGTVVAKIGTTGYATINDAITAAPDNTPTTIVLIKNTSEQVKVASGKNIIFDFRQFTLSNKSAKSILEITGGSVTMTNGELSTDTTQGAVNVKNGGQFNMSGGTITATGTRQAIYVENGTARISGSAYLTAAAEVTSDNKRGTIHVLANGNLELTGGTIMATGTSGIAVSNLGHTTIGVSDGTISTTSPLMMGEGYGFYNTATATIYDGIMKGRTYGHYTSTTITVPQGATLTDSSETIDGVTYYTTYLS